MKLFVYGELCKPAVLVAQLGRVPPAVPAVLCGFRRVLKPGSGFYEAVPAVGQRIAGLLLEGLDEADLEALDAYENVEAGEYRRAEVEVETVEEAPCRHRVFVYVAARPR